ncbi:MAG: hypothetical protein U0703_28580 [Anaerolineae bacterium]
MRAIGVNDLLADNHRRRVGDGYVLYLNANDDIIRERHAHPIRNRAGNLRLGAEGHRAAVSGGFEVQIAVVGEGKYRRLREIERILAAERFRRAERKGGRSGQIVIVPSSTVYVPRTTLQSAFAWNIPSSAKVMV